MPQIDYADFTAPENDKLLIVKFYHDAVENKFKSHEAGRPVFDDIEMLEMNFPGDRAKSLLVPAHAEWKRFGNRRVTYSERFADHYKRFKANEGPVVEGTPLSEAPFLSMADKASLKALQVYTVEQLASLTGQPLKNIGAGGLAKQQAAQAYLAKASGTAETVHLQSKIDEQASRMAEMQAQIDSLLPHKGTMDHDGDGKMGGIVPYPDYESMTAESLKDHIQSKTGTRPKGNPNNATLIAMARELDTETANAA